MARLPYDPGLVLVVSERTSYILHNLAIADIADSSRYAIYPPVDGWYQPVLPSDGPEYGVFEQIVRDFERDVLEVGTMPIYGIRDTIGEKDEYPVPGAGSYSRSFGPVPEDEIWELQLVEGIVNSGSATALTVYFGISGVFINIDVFAPMVSGISQRRAIRLHLSAGGTLLFFYNTVSAGATLESRIWYARLIQ
jgi:hypothetical protein